LWQALPGRSQHFADVLIYFPGLIHAILVVHNYYQDRRTARVIKAIKEQGRG